MYLYLSQVYDGDNMNFPLVGTFCGTSVPASFISSGNFLTVHFVTDGSVQRRGFNATYREVPCKKHFDTALHSKSYFHMKRHETIFYVQNLSALFFYLALCLVAEWLRHFFLSITIFNGCGSQVLTYMQLYMDSRLQKCDLLHFVMPPTQLG